jgi:hypothetical protein
MQKPHGVNEAKNLYRATPSRSKLQPDSIKHDSAKNKMAEWGRPPLLFTPLKGLLDIRFKL